MKRHRDETWERLGIFGIYDPAVRGSGEAMRRAEDFVDQLPAEMDDGLAAQYFKRLKEDCKGYPDARERMVAAASPY